MKNAHTRKRKKIIPNNDLEDSDSKPTNTEDINYLKTLMKLLE